MPALTLAFAETLLSNDDDHLNSPANAFVNDDFPPLLSSKNNHWEIINEDKDTFSEDSTIWVNGRSFAEAAAGAGLQHHPIFIKNTMKTSQPRKQKPKRMEIPALEDDQDDPWYQAKSMRQRKHEINATIQERRQKSLERAFHQATYKYMTSCFSKDHYQQQLAPAIDEIQNANHYLDECKGLGERIPNAYFRRGKMRRIPWEYGLSGFRHSKMVWHLSKESNVRIFKREAKEHPFTTHIFIDLVRKVYGDVRFKALYGDDPLSDFTHLEYIAQNLRYGKFLMERDVIPEYELKIIPGLKNDYNRILRKHIQALSGMLPSPKEKSHCRISRTQYARAVLSLIKDS
ncbi:hypothetical protein BDA99DRAFT_494417, partial [Phascolomyces articulosus]